MGGSLLALVAALAIEGILPKPVEVLITPAAERAASADLLIHFHGAAYVPFSSVDHDRPLVVASVHLGAGSRVYEEPFEDETVLPRLIAAVEARGVSIRRIYLSGFSAGYGAVRAILRTHPDRIAGVILMDGLHTGYLDGCEVEPAKMAPFLAFADRAARGETHFVITHSEITPGSYASTTETADYVLRALGVPRQRCGGVRFEMTQLSEAQRGNFLVMGFAGKTAPDHMRHLHAMPFLTRLLLARPAGANP